MVEDFVFVTLDVKISWTPQKIMAIFCSDRFWNGQLRDIMSRAEKSRYDTATKEWSDANGCWCGPLCKDSGKIGGFPEEDLPSIRLEVGIPRELVEAATGYDVLIFLHESNLNEARSFWKLSGSLEVPPEHIVVAHECVHIVEALSGHSLMGKHDFGVYFDLPEVMALVQRFTSSMPSGEFKRRYFYPEA